jgi:hypothetical protein
MKLYLLCILALLAGCSTTVPVTAKFPAAPTELTQRCAPLQSIDGNAVTIVDLHSTVVHNYTAYHECAIKVDAWNDWYKAQKKIFEAVK